MRLIFFLGIVGGLVWLSYRAFTGEQGAMAGLVSDKLGKGLANPVGVFRKKDAAPASPGAVEGSASAPAGVPGKAVIPGQDAAVAAPVGAPAAPVVTYGPNGPILQQAAAVGAPPGSPGAPVSGPFGGPAGGVPVASVSSFYQFKHREIPPAGELQSLQGFGIQLAADRSTGVVMMIGPGPAVNAAEGFLARLDAVAGSCAVQTWAVYVDRSAQKGFDLVAALRAVAGCGNSVSLGQNGFTLDLGAGEIALALDAICSGGAVEVVQRPHVRLANGVVAKIESTQEFPIPATTLSNGIAQTSIVYRKVGLELGVTPSFLSRDRVRLAVVQRNGIVGNNVEIEGNAIPVIETQSVETTAEMTVGQTIVLGGVATQRVRVSRGLLGAKREVVEGFMYVILSTYFDEPKAITVEGPRLESPGVLGPVPFGSAGQLPGDWILGELLPPLGETEPSRK